MSGIETGLDLTQAMARVPEGVEAHAVRRLLLGAEAEILTVIADRRAEEKAHGKA